MRKHAVLIVIIALFGLCSCGNGAHAVDSDAVQSDDNFVDNDQPDLSEVEGSDPTDDIVTEADIVTDDIVTDEDLAEGDPEPVEGDEITPTDADTIQDLCHLCWEEYKACLDGETPACGDCLSGYHVSEDICVIDDIAAENMIYYEGFSGAWKHNPPVTLGEWSVTVSDSTDNAFEGTLSLKSVYASDWAMTGIYKSNGDGAGQTTPVSFPTADTKIVFYAYSPATPLSSYYLTGIASTGLIESDMVSFNDIAHESAGSWTKYTYDLDEFAADLIGFGVRVYGPATIYLDNIHLEGICTEGSVQLCGLGTGECHVGLSTCGSDGAWGDCAGDKKPSEEVCDDLDNDCDGAADGEPASEWCRKEHLDPGLICESGGCVTCTSDCDIASDPCDVDHCGDTCGTCAAVAYRDFGKGDPFATAEDIRLVPASETICDNCWFIYSQTAETCAVGNVDDEEYCAFWETYDRTGGTVNDQFEYITRPASFAVDSWGVKFRKYGRLRINAVPFVDHADDTLYLTVRYKDIVLPGAYGDGASVYIRNGASWERLGGIGGEMDFYWKTTQFAIASGDRQASSGAFELSFGRYDNEYTDEMLGEIQIDQLRLALDKNTFDESLADPTPGAGAEPLDSSFPQIGFDSILSTDAGAQPFFTYGAYHIQATFTDTLAQQMAAAGMNTVATIQWTTAIEELIHDYAAVAQGRGLKFFATMIGDFWPWAVASSTQASISRYEHKMQNVLDHHKDMIADFTTGANASLHDTILFWGSKDEVDHDQINSADGGAPPLSFLRNYANMIKETDPSIPHIVLTMGWHSPGEFGVFGGIGEVITEDHYINTESVAEDDFEARITRTRETGDRLDNMRDARDPEKNLMLAVIQGMYTPGDRIAAKDIVAQCYQAITHGAQGIIFFKFIEATAYPEEYAGMTQVGNELFGTDGIAAAIMAEGSTIDIMGENGVVTIPSDTDGKISHIYKFDGTHHYLIAVMVGTAAADYNGSMNPGIAIGDMTGQNRTVDVLFEGRTVNMVNGVITDPFNGFGSRHVYRW